MNDLLTPEEMEDHPLRLIDVLPGWPPLYRMFEDMEEYKKKVEEIMKYNYGTVG